MYLNALVMTYHRMQLCSVEGACLLGFYLTLEWLSSQARYDFLQKFKEIASKNVINVELGRTRRSKVCVVDRKGGVDEGLMVPLHDHLAWCSIRASRSWLCRHGTRSNIELLLEVLDIKPEAQVLFTEVTDRKSVV